MFDTLLDLLGRSSDNKDLEIKLQQNVLNNKVSIAPTTAFNFYNNSITYNSSELLKSQKQLFENKEVKNQEKEVNKAKKPKNNKI